MRNWFTVGVIGLGFAIAASSFHRYTAVRNVTDDSAAGMIASFAAILLGCLALFFISRKDMRLYSRPAFLVCMLVVCTVRALLLVSPLGGIISTDVLAPVVEVLRVAEIGLLLAYAEFFMRLGAGNHIKAFGLALMITGTVEFASAFITVVAAQVLLVLVAALAPTLLWVAARSQMRLSPDIDETREATVVHNVIDVSKAPSLLWALWIMLFLVVALFGNIHTSWIPEQDAAITSQLIQITAGSTTILVGNIIFLARHVLEDPLTTDFCKNLVLPLTVVGLLLTYLVAGPLVASYIILLNFAQRFTLFIIWFSPLMYSIEGIHLRQDAKKSGMGAATRVFCYSLMAYYLGKVCRGVLLSAFQSGTAHTVIQASYAVVIFVVGAYSFVMMRKVSAAAVEPVPQQGQAGGTGYRAKFKEACEQIIAEYDLTKREGEVFVLLAKGRTTDAIAERLVISPATAQTHVKNIYHKLGVRSRQVLMDMVEERAEEALKQQG